MALSLVSMSRRYSSVSLSLLENREMVRWYEYFYLAKVWPVISSIHFDCEIQLKRRPFPDFFENGVFERDDHFPFLFPLSVFSSCPVVLVT